VGPQPVIVPSVSQLLENGPAERAAPFPAVSVREPEPPSGSSTNEADGPPAAHFREILRLRLT